MKWVHSLKRTTDTKFYHLITIVRKVIGRINGNSALSVLLIHCLIVTKPLGQGNRGDMREIPQGYFFEKTKKPVFR